MRFVNLLPNKITPIAVGLTLSLAAHADWTLDSEQSDLNFVSIKKDSIAEIHEFASLSGAVKDDGAFSLSVDLSSVKTQIDIRDERMKEHLFEVNSYPTATITGSLTKELLKSLKKGKAVPIETDVTIHLHGEKITKAVKLEALKLNRKTIHVNSLDPIIINASEFGLEAGVNKLKELAALPNIAFAIPVTLHLVFEKS